MMTLRYKFVWNWDRNVDNQTKEFFTMIVYETESAYEMCLALQRSYY